MISFTITTEFLCYWSFKNTDHHKTKHRISFCWTCCHLSFTPLSNHASLKAQFHFFYYLIHLIIIFILHLHAWLLQFVFTKDFLSTTFTNDVLILSLLKWWMDGCDGNVRKIKITFHLLIYCHFEIEKVPGGTRAPTNGNAHIFRTTTKVQNATTLRSPH